MTREEAIKWYGRIREDCTHGSRRRTWKEAEAHLGRVDLFYLLVCILGRKDANRDWLFDRCREVQAEPDG